MGRGGTNTVLLLTVRAASLPGGHLAGVFGGPTELPKNSHDNKRAPRDDRDRPWLYSCICGETDS